MQPAPPEPAPSASQLDNLEAQKMILEQYKVYVEMHDRISARRTQMNRFYVSLLSALLALLAIAPDKGLLQNPTLKVSWIGIGIGLLGTILCCLWNLNIHSYAALVARKVKVIIQMEQSLPVQCYAQEGRLRTQELAQKSYLRITQIEKLATLVFATVYIALFTVSLVGALK